MDPMRIEKLEAMSKYRNNLFGESKLGGSYASPGSDIYDEYVKMSRRLPRHSSLEEKEENEKKWENFSIEESVKRVEEYGEDKEEKGGEEKIVEEVEKKEGEEDLDGEEELGLHAEEIHKMVEDFIARVNKQRRLEATILSVMLD